ncbi:hypothetical protein [Stenotrophomonas sp.]|uniref:hypothetical protein n=1 Tax=Stenotrophomonas sp. TaxID=69392 RepID=UPI002FCB012B
MDFNASLSRFYALPVTTALADAIDTDFAQAHLDDLVHAHLSGNPLYFGGIDKTLSGFVVLDDIGDNYTLLDLRGDGTVWWQDHETRQVEPRFANLDDYLAFRARLAEDEDEAALLAEYACRQPIKPGSTAALLARYQWLMHALALPTRDREGHALHSGEELAVDAYGRLIGLFPQDGDDQRCFRKELPQLAADPHLALYWLLHASLLGQDKRLASVLAAIDGTTVPLLQAFVAVFGAMADDADIAVVPEFRHRRARLMMMAQYDTGAPLRERLRMLAVSPHTVGMPLVDELTLALEQDPDALDAVAALQAVDAIQDATAPSVWALRAYLQHHLGQPAGDAADQATRLLASGAHPPLGVVQLLYPIAQQIHDGTALLAVVTPLLAWDDLMTRVLDLVERAQQLTHIELLSVEALAERRHLAEDLLTIWDAPGFAAGVAAAAPATREAMAIRLARRPILADTDEDREWAIGFLAAGTLPNRGALLQRALPQLSAQMQRHLLPAICASVTDPGDGLVPMLLALLGEQPPAGDISAEMDADARADAILKGLAAHWGDPRLFEPLMTMLTDAPINSVLVDRLGPLTDTLQAVLDTSQRQRLFHWAVARVAAREDDYWSPRVLERLNSVDLVPSLCTTLEARSQALATLRPADDKLLSSLYDSLGDIAKHDPPTAAYLVDRLWKEQAYPRGLYWALYMCRSPELHTRVMAQLQQRPSVAAAAVYCVSIHSWDKYPDRALDVADQVLAWPMPQQAEARAWYKYLMLLGTAAALPRQEPERVRAFHQRASEIEEVAREPGARSEQEFDPFRDEVQREALQDVLDGKAEKALATLQARLLKARRDGVPDTRVSLQGLGQLAGGTAAFAWYRDPTSGATLFQDVLGNTHYFDGYAITAPPFQTQGYTLSDPGPAFFHDATEVSGRWMCWKGETFFDWTRLGAAINVIHGQSNAWGQIHLALRCASEEEAARLFALIQTTPAKGFVACDPWYRDGYGEVSRSLSNPRKPGGTRLRLRNGVWTDDQHKKWHGDDALAAVNALEVDARRAGGFTYTIEYQDECKRPQDLSLLDWFSELGRINGEGILDTLAQTVDVICDYLAAHALHPGGTRISMRRDGPAPAADLQAVAAACTHPLPEALLACWQQHASIGWHFPGHGRRLLSPAEVLASPLIDGHRPLVVDDHGAPQWLLVDHADAYRQILPLDPSIDKRYSFSVEGGVRNGLLERLLDALERDLADIALLWHGQRGDADIQRVQLGNERETTTLRLDLDAGLLAIHKAKRGQRGKVRFHHLATPAKAAAAFDKARKAAEAAGQQAQASA